MSEEHTPYFSVRVRIGDITSPKDLIGLKERTIEITIGNSTNPITYRNPGDVADTKSQDLKEMIMSAFEQTDEVAKARGFTFLDKATPKVEEKK